LAALKEREDNKYFKSKYLGDTNMTDMATTMNDNSINNMKITDPANASFLNKAVSHLNRETQRGEHAPMVGGHPHDPLMR
jgi:hypothetical protein